MERRVLLFRFGPQTDGAILRSVLCNVVKIGGFIRLKVLNDSSSPMCFCPCSFSIPLCYLTLTLSFFSFSSLSISLADTKGQAISISDIWCCKVATRPWWKKKRKGGRCKGRMVIVQDKGEEKDNKNVRAGVERDKTATRSRVGKDTRGLEGMNHSGCEISAWAGSRLAAGTCTFREMTQISSSCSKNPTYLKQRVVIRYITRCCLSQLVLGSNTRASEHHRGLARIRINSCIVQNRCVIRVNCVDFQLYACLASFTCHFVLGGLHGSQIS